MNDGPRPMATGDPAARAERTDGDLLAAVTAGQLDALGVLYDRYRTMAYSIAYRITGDGTAAEDVVQEAFVGVWRNAARYAEGRASVRTWLLSIVHHRAVDAVRRRRPTIELPEREEASPSALTLPDVWGDVSGRLDAEAVRHALKTLPDPQREALELAYYAGLTQLEISERTGAPLGTVKSRMRLGLLSLRRALGDATAAEPSIGART
jgi:RNA polymerase sigma-70 factor, ECF subfamily